MNILNNISDISNKYYHHFFSKANVVGVGAGFKFTNHKETNQLSIQVFVKKKVRKAYLGCNNIIPRTYMGLLTDVIEIGTPKILGSNTIINGRYRPLKGGCTIYTKDASLDGTLGCIVVRKQLFKDKYFILSNNHVLADSNKIILGAEVIQPTLKYGGKFQTDVVARLTQFHPLNFPTALFKPKNFVDCAIAEVTNKSLISKEVLKIGKLAGVATPTLGTHVRKTGSKSDLTDGKITSINTTMEVNFDSKKLLFSNQIFASLPSLKGDSGSVVVDDNNKVLGLLFASDSSGNHSLINDINLVLKILNVEIYK